MSDKLPELPPADFAAWAEGDNGIPKITTGYSSEATLAYGQQCYQQALEDAEQMLMAEHERRWHNDDHALFFAHKVRALGEKK